MIQDALAYLARISATRSSVVRALSASSLGFGASLLSFFLPRLFFFESEDRFSLLSRTAIGAPPQNDPPHGPIDPRAGSRTETPRQTKEGRQTDEMSKNVLSGYAVG